MPAEALPQSHICGIVWRMEQSSRFLAPFVGRQSLLVRLHQYASAPAPYTLTMIGFEGMGKSALLAQLAHSDARLIGVVVRLVPYSVSSESVWLETLMNATVSALEQSNIARARLPNLDNAGDLRTCLTETWLPSVLRVLRPHQRILWLLDDVHYLADAITYGQMPADSLRFLCDLVRQTPALSIINTLDPDRIRDIGKLAPLVDVQHCEVLERLSSDDSQNLLQAVLEYVPESLTSAVTLQTGGIPHLLTQVAERLRRYEPLDDAVDATYHANAAYFRKWWGTLTRDERIVLTATINRMYEDPLRAVTPPLLETWLIKTDFPMDITTIQAQLRGLEYRAVIRLTRQDVTLVSQLFQRWLFENARLDEMRGGTSGRSWLLALIVLVALVAAVALLMALLPDRTSARILLPTVTFGR